MDAPLPKPLIFGVSGPVLTSRERAAFSKINPLGFILFKKNLIEKQQCRQLCEDLREAVGRNDIPILVDQEGGAVNRLAPPLWRQPPAPLELGKFAYSPIQNALERAAHLVCLNAQLIGYEMYEVGLNVNCAPVADLLNLDAHPITSSRSFGPNPLITTTLVNHMAMGLQKSGVQAIIKHMPGQGRAQQDSHLKLPLVDTDLQTLEQTDFFIFKNALSGCWGMTAHIQYSCLDTLPVTYSQKSISYIRDNLNFDGTLFTDCLTMQALPDPLSHKAAKALDAGIDIALYGGCSLKALHELTENMPLLRLETYLKIQENLKALSPPAPMDYAKILSDYTQHLSEMTDEFNHHPESHHSLELRFILRTLADRNDPLADYSSPLYKA